MGVYLDYIAGPGVNYQSKSWMDNMTKFFQAYPSGTFTI